jgi:hypothetical protein
MLGALCVFVCHKHLGLQQTTLPRSPEEKVLAELGPRQGHSVWSTELEGPQTLQTRMSPLYLTSWSFSFFLAIFTVLAMIRKINVKECSWETMATEGDVTAGHLPEVS